MLTADELFEAYALPDRGTPRLRMNFVASMDGAATLGGRSAGLGGATDHRLMGVLRAMADVVVVGAGTVRAEGYGGTRVEPEDAAWRVERGLAEQPRLAVVSRTLDIEPRHPFFAEAVQRPIVVTCRDAPAERLAALSAVADVVAVGDATVDVALLRQELARLGMPQVLCEGGPHLFGALADAGAVDEICLTVAPRLVGGSAGRILAGAAEADRRFALAHALTDDEGFVFLRYVSPGAS
jgi:riboflavin biosynthesis pyrimidine reductase